MIYLFAFTLENGRKIFLTSSNNILKIGLITYQPNSSLSLDYIEKSNFHTEANIKGFFEEGGIEENQLMDNSCLKIFQYDTNPSIISSLEFDEIKNDGISFEMRFISKSASLNRNLVSRISKTCRANLGDNRCKVDISKFLERVRLISIDKNKIIIYKGGQMGGYFNNGRLVSESGKSYNIISYNPREVVIDGIIEAEENSEIILYPSCDKEFNTCCHKFQNAINFRGEPFIGIGYEKK